MSEIYDGRFSLRLSLNSRHQCDHPGNLIFIFLDGTWNEERDDHGAATATNVLRMYQYITTLQAQELLIGNTKNRRVIARYYRGVGSRQDNGTLDRLWLGFSGADEERIRASAFAQLYEDNEHSTDKIFIFGFSRGAASARLLASQICHEGLPLNLVVYKRHFSNKLTGQIEARVDRIERIGSETVDRRVHFLGCWETVDAFVLPSRFPHASSGLQKLKNKIARLFVPRLFGEKRFSLSEREIHEKVFIAIHCVAIDETRNAFLPTLMVPANFKNNVFEVWFPGVHADVGGGYRDSGLSEAPFQFMKKQLLIACNIEKNDLSHESRSFEYDLPSQYCFHFHGLNSDVQSVKNAFGFGTAIRRIRIPEYRFHSYGGNPYLHESVFQVQNSGYVFAANRDDKKIWHVKYDPYNVAELKGNFHVVNHNLDFTRFCR